jgi:hypothetical protein
VRGLIARFVFLTAVTIEDCDVDVYSCFFLTSIQINQTTRRHIHKVVVFMCRSQQPLGLRPSWERGLRHERVVCVCDYCRSRDSSVGIATNYGLHDQGFRV